MGCLSNRCARKLSTLESALTSLPKTLDDTYNRILRAIPPEHKRYATIPLHLIAFSERPVTVEEDVDAIAIRTDRKPELPTIDEN